MTGVLQQAIGKLAERIRDCGCEEGLVVLRRDPDSPLCQYECGVCIVARFGGKEAEFVSYEPTEASTKLSFLFDAVPESPRGRAAAYTVINAVTGFLCISRRLRACTPDHHAACAKELMAHFPGISCFPVGQEEATRKVLGIRPGANPDSADLLLITGDGLVSGKAEALFDSAGDKPHLFLAPSTAGYCALTGEPHWCPYGRG